MKRILVAAAVATVAVAASAQGTVVIGQPGYYGRIDVGNYPPPALIYPQPVLVGPVAPGGLVSEPIYLHVPPDQARNWSKHCHWYGACGTPVYFVQDAWYQQVYVPRYRDRHDRGRHDGWGGYDGGNGWPGRGHGRHSDGWNN